MARDDPQFMLRMPIDLDRKVESAKSESGRSKNAEIVYRLQSSFDSDFGSGLTLISDKNTNDFISQKIELYLEKKYNQLDLYFEKQMNELDQVFDKFKKDKFLLTSTISQSDKNFED